MKIKLISLGCSKNFVDSEVIAGFLKNNHFIFTYAVADADIIIINTCAFLQSARQEAIDTIFEIYQEKQANAKIVVIGCLAQRYHQELIAALPEADLIIPISNYNRFAEIFSAITPVNNAPLSFLQRFLNNPFHAYIKISDGCNNRCAYCAIPLIRGNFTSRKSAQIIEEAKSLLQRGVKEITLVSQDTTRYGTDLEGEIKLPQLLEKLAQLDNLFCLRVLYLYPTEVSDELINVIKQNPVIAPYFDIPIQHASDKILAAMGRRGTQKNYLNLIKRIKNQLPHAIIRTTIITGFPGEDEHDFQILLNFIKQAKFDRLGVFTYSKEEGTPAYKMKNNVNKKIALRRKEELILAQEKISLRQNQKMINKVVAGIIIDIKENLIIRSFMFAPDDVDGVIIAPKENNCQIGDIVYVKITHAITHDLLGIVLVDCKV